MNIKHKLLAILLIFLVVFVGGGYILYNLYASTNIGEGILTTFGIGNEYANANIIALPIENQSTAHMNTTRSNSVIMEESTPDFSQVTSISRPEIDLNKMNTNVSITDKSTIKTKRSFNQVSSNDDLLMLAATANGRNSKAGLSEYGNYGNSIAVGHKNNIPIAKPFSNSGAALVDPEPDTLDESTRIVPLGQGTWFLGLLALGYGCILYIRRRS